MSDRYVESEYVSWGSKLKESIGGVIFGLILFVAAFPVLFFNEGRAVNTAKALEEGAGAVISVPSDDVNSNNDGKLVHMTGTASTEEFLTDSTFGVERMALKLKREVKMYQWKESKETRTEKKMGGGEERITTYTYSKEWSSTHNNSSGFKKPEGHTNPPEIPYGQKVSTASVITIGAFVLSDTLKSGLTNYSPFPVDDEALARVDQKLREKLNVSAGNFYTGNPASPAVGDVKISFFTVEPQTVSVVSKQSGDTFTPYIASNGRRVELLQYGNVDAAAMFQRAQTENTIFTWIVRVVGCLMMLIGLSLIFKPIAVVGDVIPIVGDLLGMGIGIFASILAIPLSLITIAVAWIVYRPVLGVILLGVATAIIVGGFKMARGKKVEALPASGGPPPIPE